MLRKVEKVRQQSEFLSNLKSLIQEITNTVDTNKTETVSSIEGKLRMLKHKKAQNTSVLNMSKEDIAMDRGHAESVLLEDRKSVV